MRLGVHAREAERQLALVAHTRMQLLQSVRTALRATVAPRPLVQPYAWRGTRRPLTPPHVHLALPVHFLTATALLRVQYVLQDRTVRPSQLTQ